MSTTEKDAAMILVINAGSSSIKFALYAIKKSDQFIYRGQIDSIGSKSLLSVFDAKGTAITDKRIVTDDHPHALNLIIQEIDTLDKNNQIIAVGHRVVHGGKDYTHSVVINNKVMADLERLIPLASLHQPYNLAAITLLAKRSPELLQVACFDTAFHATMPAVEKQIALDHTLLGDEVRRYGFHGLSYQSIMQKLPNYLEEKKENDRIIIAHLGAGASLCAIKNKQSIATTMSFTPLDGLAMATRCGSLDPGLVLYLQQEKKFTVEQLSDSFNHHSGLKAISGFSDNMQTLLASHLPEAKAAVDYFVYHTVRHLGAMIAVLGGLDVLVFTAGIGQHEAAIREQICEQLSWLGLKIDQDKNEHGKAQIDHTKSQVSILVIATDEEQLIAKQTIDCLNKKQ